MRTAALRQSLLILLACLGLSSVPAYGQAPLTRYKHVRWTADDGAPVGNGQLAQTPDGYLWIASDALYRFDGVSFERIAAEPGSPQERTAPISLFVSRSGDLWVGYRGGGGVAVFRQGRLRDTHMPSPPLSMAFVSQTADGAIWASSGQFRKRLWRLSSGRWDQVDERLLLPAGAVMGMHPTAAGGLWVPLVKEGGKEGGLAYLPPSGARFTETRIRLSPRSTIAASADGSLWVADADGVRMLLDRDSRPVSHAGTVTPMPQGRLARIVFDPAGAIWGTAEGKGIFRMRAVRPGRSGAVTAPEIFTAADGLSSDTVYQPFVDREGSIWFSTELGIDQFRRASAIRDPDIPADPVGGLALDVSTDGWVYIVSNGSIFAAGPRERSRRIAGLKAQGASVCAARDGGAWVVQRSQVVRIRRDQLVRLPGFARQGEPIDCAEDARGRLWVGFQDGLIWRDSAGWHRPAGTPGSIGI